jgi:hypothetical protein
MINWWALHYDPEYYPEPEKVYAILNPVNGSSCLSVFWDLN